MGPHCLSLYLTLLNNASKKVAADDNCRRKFQMIFAGVLRVYSNTKMFKNNVNMGRLIGSSAIFKEEISVYNRQKFLICLHSCGV